MKRIKKVNTRVKIKAKSIKVKRCMFHQQHITVKREKIHNKKMMIMKRMRMTCPCFYENRITLTIPMEVKTTIVVIITVLTVIVEEVEVIVLTIIIIIIDNQMIRVYR